MTPELIFYAGSSLLESPCWDARNEVIYFVSIEQGLIYGLAPKSGMVQTIQCQGPVGCVVVEATGALLVAEKTGIYRLDVTTGQKDFLAHLEPDSALRYNDGKLDPRGRFLVGTKGDKSERPGQGRLFSYCGVEERVLAENLTISNGIGFSPSAEWMYFIDSPTQKIARYHYEIETGLASFDRYVVSIDGDAFPDGMCVDEDGALWVAEWEGGCVCKWDPETGSKLAQIAFPVPRVTSCCLGGSMNEYLFVTTAKEATGKPDGSGGLYQVRIR